MTIIDWAVDNDVLTIRLEDMPQSADIDNTSVWIGGKRQVGKPLEVSPRALKQIVRLRRPIETGRILVSIDVKTIWGKPEQATSTEYYNP
jgi:hypothetical protein